MAPKKKPTTPSLPFDGKPQRGRPTLEGALQVAGALAAYTQNEAVGQPVPRLKSLDEVDQALLEMARLSRIEAQVNQSQAKVMYRVLTTFEKKLLVEVDGVQVKIGDRRAQLEADIEAFCEAYREAILQDDKKSRELNHGTIGWHAGKDKIEEIPALKKNEETAWDRFADLVIGRIRDALLKMRLGIGKTAAAVLRLKVEPDKIAVLSHFKKKLLSEEGLETMGLRFVPAKDKFYCEPKQQTIESLESVPAPTPPAAA